MQTLRRAVKPYLIRAFVSANRMLFEEILVLGDSHAVVFKHKVFKRAFPRYFFNVVSVEGATASGLDNPNSKTQAYPIFERALNTTKAKKVIVMLGEVDTGFVIWYRAKKHGAPVGVTAEKTLAVYSSFLKSIDLEVVCVSAPLPTIEDGNNWGEIANARKEISATQAERTALTLDFNRRMQAICEANNIAYLMLDGESLGENGLVKEDLLHDDSSNHHYDRDAYAALIAAKLAPLLEQTSAPRMAASTR